MSSTAMALAGLGVTINGTAVTPKSLNQWLIDNNGYVCLADDCDNLVLTAPERLSPVMSLIGESQKPSYEEIAATITYERIIHVAHVKNDSHFVLLTGVPSVNTTDELGFFVHDPYYNVTFYPYGNISDIIRFKINDYPVYKQCDSQWGSNIMGKNNATICEVGCLMSSISSAIAGTGITIPPHRIVSNPATVNVFLQTHPGGFVDNSSALNESVIPEINPLRIQWPADGMHHSNDLSFATIKQYIDQKQPRIVIANVMHGQHFVLVVGYRNDNDTLVVNDPGFNRNTYSYSQDVVGWRIFDMK